MADKIATREAYGAALAELGDKYDFVVLDATLPPPRKQALSKRNSPRDSSTAASRKRT
jgi:transketolase